MSNNTDFCPECSSVLHPMELSSENGKKGLFLGCQDCSWKSEEVKTYSIPHFTKNVKKNAEYVNSSRIAKDYIYDVTYQRTTQNPCANEKCPSKKTNINPEIVLITSKNRPEIKQLCVECNYIWG